MLIPSRFKENHPKLRSNFFGDPKSRPMGAGRDLYGMKKDGSEFPIEIGLNPIETDEGPMVLSAIVDISSRKRLEERFRQVVESAPNAMVMINQSGKIEMVNAQAERMFDYERSEMLKRSAARHRELIKQIPGVVVMFALDEGAAYPRPVFVSPQTQEILGVGVDAWLHDYAAVVERIPPEDPARLAIFQQQLNYATQGYQLTARTIQNIQTEDKTLAEMLRDA